MPSIATGPLVPDFDAGQFRRALGRFATGVTIVTTRAPDGGLVGLTANSFNSVSLDPPLVLWSLSSAAASLPFFERHTHYAINILGAHQLALAQRFATKGAERFSGVAFRVGQGGAPVLPDSLAWFECFNRSRYREGDHTIMVGQVERCGWAEGTPLIYHAGGFSVESTDPAQHFPAQPPAPQA